MKMSPGIPTGKRARVNVMTKEHSITGGHKRTGTTREGVKNRTSQQHPQFLELRHPSGNHPLTHLFELPACYSGGALYKTRATLKHWRSVSKARPKSPAPAKRYVYPFQSRLTLAGVNTERSRQRCCRYGEIPLLYRSAMVPLQRSPADGEMKAELNSRVRICYSDRLSPARGERASERNTVHQAQPATGLTNSRTSATPQLNDCSYTVYKELDGGCL
jgi:hypothetical protein